MGGKYPGMPMPLVCDGDGARHQQDAPFARMATPFGNMKVVASGIDHLYLCCLTDTQLTVNGVRMHVSMHLRNYRGDPRHGGGLGFEPDRGVNKKEMAYHSLWTKRDWNRDRGCQPEVSESAKTKLLEQLPACVHEWLRGPDCPHIDFLKHGVLVTLNNQLLSKAEAIREAEEKVDELRAESRQLAAREVEVHQSCSIKRVMA